jgi:hypothetical protein
MTRFEQFIEQIKTMTREKRILEIGKFVKTMTREKRILEIGKIGEKLVQDSLLKKEHKIVTLSEDRYDPEKDMIADGQYVQVKTLVRIINENAFCLGSDQEKHLHVARLMFVEISCRDDIKIYESEKPRETYRKFFKKTDKNGKIIYDKNGKIIYDECILFKLTKLREFDTIKNKKLTAAYLHALSPSNFLRG